MKFQTLAALLFALAPSAAWAATPQDLRPLLVEGKRDELAQLLLHADDPYYQYLIGNTFAWRNTARDDVFAVTWFQRSAEAGDPGGQYGLGFMYQWGRGGLDKDQQQARHWYDLAAQQDYAPAQADLGLLH